MEQKKNIAITLQEAKEWYKGDNPTLKELALKAFTKEELVRQELPKTWDEFCEKYYIKEKEAFINSASDIVSLNNYFSNRTFRLCDGDKNLCTSAQEAEAFLALMQLRQLRKAYVKEWKPNWTCDSTKFCIIVDVDRIRVTDHYYCSRNLSFPTYELAEQFLNNFKDLLEMAKPLL